MALIEINLDPSERDLKWFGLLALVFFAIIGSLVFWFTSFTSGAYVLWAFGLLFSSVYYLVKPIRKVMYTGWLKLFQPLGWIIGHALFAIIYFGVFALIGLGLRLTGHDPMRRRRQSDAGTYWIPRDADVDSSRYFRQF